MTNPYAPPGGSYPHGLPHGPLPPAGTRSTGLTVLAWFSVILGGLGLWSGPMTLLLRSVAKDPVSRRIQELTWSGVYGTWMYFVLAAGFVASSLLVATGVGIFRMRPWARTTGLVYGAVNVVLTIVGQVITFALFAPLMARLTEEFPGNAAAQGAAIGRMAGGVVGALFGLTLPIAMLIVMTRPATKAAFDAAALASPSRT